MRAPNITFLEDKIMKETNNVPSDVTRCQHMRDCNANEDPEVGAVLVYYPNSKPFMSVSRVRYKWSFAAGFEM